MVGPRDYTPTTRMALAALSEGVCYFPECGRPIIRFEDDEPFVDCHIAHIHDAKPGNRYVATMTDDERRSFPNLLLLCKPHHDLVDKRHPERFDAETLRGWKQDRESGIDASELGAVVESDLEDLLTDVAARIQPRIDLGGRGGAAPGAGGGGGGAIGPGAVGGDGGAGGQVIDTYVEWPEEWASVRVTAGRGGDGGDDGPGADGEDTIVEFLDGAGRVKHEIRAAGGRGGAAGPSEAGSAVRSILLCNAVDIRDGLAFALGLGWSTYRVPSFPATVAGVALIELEPLATGSVEVVITVTAPNQEVFDLGRLPQDVAAVGGRLLVATPLVFEAAERGVYVVTVATASTSATTTVLVEVPETASTEP